ncbi:hypothetical protein QC763_308000 [Podospora pseudopauciseta]|uniref:Uncharacterized protein n=1 Tax=Podospora pseudopauciseta TaxID=2093780 RepID=A0ABR0HHF4_9PEZI|nr:hypothetical protein QC763_308000 [Podospora pseudopauciseta]
MRIYISSSGTVAVSWKKSVIIRDIDITMHFRSVIELLAMSSLAVTGASAACTPIPSSSTATPTPTPSVTPDCGGDQSIALCCMNLAPWSTNSGIWGGACGYYPADPNERVGARCITRAPGTNCFGSLLATCCAGFIPGQCSLGTRCT